MFAMNTFDKFDVDESGALNFGEFRDALERLNYKDLQLAGLQRLQCLRSTWVQNHTITPWRILHRRNNRTVFTM